MVRSVQIVGIMCLAGMLVEPATHQASPAGSNSRDLAQRGKLMLDAGDLEAALTSLVASREKLDREATGDIELADFLALQLYNLGVRFFNGSDAPSAMTCFTEILKLSGTGHLRDTGFRHALAEAVLDVAGFLVGDGKPELTLEAYRLLPGLVPGDSRVPAGLGRALLARGDYQGALALYRQADLERPESPVGASGLGRVALTMARDATPGEVVPLLVKATDWLRRACTLDPDNSSLQRELGSGLILLSQAAGRSGDVAEATRSAREAESAFRRAVSLGPENVWAGIDLAGLLLRSRRYRESIPVLSEAVDALDRMLAESPSDRNASAWREARGLCVQNRAIASFNLAVDAVNRAEFDQVEPHLEGICSLSSAWMQNCRSLREAGAARDRVMREVVGAHERTLAGEPGSAVALLALADLYAGLGRYDRALEYYGRLDRGSRTAEILEKMADAAPPGVLVERRRRIDLPESRVEIRFYRDQLDSEFESALKAAWLRVVTALGPESVRGPLLVTLYPNRRAFREQAGYRVGGMVKGNYSPGQVSLFERPGQTVVEWVSVLTHEITHHAIEKLSGGEAPRWLSEGLARWVEGDSAVIDRGRVRLRLSANALRSLASMDESMDRFWNDPDEILDGRDVALLAVEELARRQGTDGLRKILETLATTPLEIDRALKGVVGTGVDGIDAAWRGSILAGR